MSSFQLVNVWTDPEPGLGGFNPMSSSLLWAPNSFRPGQPVPAFIFVPGWGGYPYDATASAFGPQLADAGFLFLSLSMRRRGMEGQLNSAADNDLRDLKVAVDYLHTNGASRVYLVAEGVGGASALRYAARCRDMRIAGIAWLDPQEQPDIWLQQAIGSELYQQAMHTAGVSARQGTGMDMRIDLSPSGAPPIAQNALPFLSWWAPQADLNLERNLQDTRVPILALAELGAKLPAALEKVSPDRLTVVHQPAHERVTGLIDWAARNGAEHLLPVPVEMVRVNSGGKELFGLLWVQADGKPVSTVTLLMHGLTSSPLSPLFGKMAPVLAQTGTAVLAVESRRSGWGGHETALLDYDAEDLDVWVNYLVQAGYRKIVLAGASMGSLSIGRYQSLRQHPNVVALAHLMPTAECPDWYRQAAGEGPYAAAVEQARRAVEENRGASELIDIDVRQPPPNRYGGRFRWTQRAASWLSWWGPDADSRNLIHIANAAVPVLLLSGTEDSYNDKQRFAELRAAAVNAPSVDEIWYRNVDHGLAGVERQVARDLLAWMRKVGAI